MKLGTPVRAGDYKGRKGDYVSVVLMIEDIDDGDALPLYLTMAGQAGFEPFWIRKDVMVTPVDRPIAIGDDMLDPDRKTVKVIALHGDQVWAAYEDGQAKVFNREQLTSP